MPSGRILLLGDGDLAEEVRGTLDALEADVVRLVKPTQREVAEVFERGDVDRAVVVSGDDAFALRMALKGKTERVRLYAPLDAAVPARTA